MKSQAALLGKEGRKPGRASDAQETAVSVRAGGLLGHTRCSSAPLGFPKRTPSSGAMGAVPPT